MTNHSNLRVTAIVTTRNSAATLERLLVSLRNQSHTDLELVVVDNASHDETSALAAKYADRVFQGGPERSAQRNLGIASASGEYVVVLDADMIVEPQTLAECVEVAETSGAMAVVIPESTIGDSFLARVRALERRCYENDATVEAARFFRADAVRRIGGYDERLTGPEDWDLPARLRSEGAVVARAHSARILHDESELRLSDHIRKKYYYGKSFPTYLSRHPGLGARQISPARAALIRNAPSLARQPLLGGAVFALKAAEAAAGAAGLAVGAAARRRRR